jgi:hypothetical protein
MGALAAAMLIGILLFVLLGRFGTDEGTQAAPVRDAQATPADAALPERVLLAVTMLGGGDGVIQIQPGDIACTKSCEHEFETGTRVTVTADAKSGSTFSGWADACDGTGTCSLRMNAGRSLDATFDPKPTAPVDPLCDPDLDLQDPACADNGLDTGADAPVPGDEPLGAPPAPVTGDCADGRDNDGDGLTDAAQDPNCSTGSSEAGGGTSTGGTAPPPPPPAAPKECSDKRDNDGDGLIDTAQDPGCPGGGTET